MTLAARLRALVASPLLHFFVLGGLVFGYYQLVTQPEADVLRLTEADAHRLVVDLAGTHHRAPNPEELRALIRDWAIEEASAREALSLTEEWRASEARKMREAYVATLLQRYALDLPEIPDAERAGTARP